MGIRLIERLLSRRPVMALTAMAAAVFVLAAMLVARKHEAASELADAQRLAQLALLSARAAHELQGERGMSLGFLASGGKRFAAPLSLQRKRASERLAELSGYGDSIGAVIRARLGGGMPAAIGRSSRSIAGLRGQVDNRDLGEREAFRRYSLEIEALLGLATRALAVQGELDGASESASPRMAAFLALLRGKEESGIERGLLNMAFSANRSGREIVEDIKPALHAQQAYLKLFLDLAPAQEAQAFRERLSANFADELELERMRKAPFAPGGASEEAERWFDLMSRRIDAMNFASEQLGESIAGAMGASSRRLRAEMQLGAAFMLISLAAILLLWLAEALLRSRRRHELAAKIFENTVEGITVTDAAGTILRVNRAFCDITGYRAEEAVGRNPRILQSGRHDAAFYADMWRHVADTGSWSGEIWNRRKSGEIYPETLSVSALRDGSGRITHYIGVFSDISQHKKSESLIEELSRYDILTGLLNWGAVQEELLIVLRRAWAGSKGQPAVMLLGLDRFRNVNDSLGHVGGDLVLETVAARLAEAAGAGARTARRSGDEFCIIFPEVESEAAMRRCAERILGAVSEPMLVSGHEVVMTASIGFSLSPRDGQDAAQLIRRAEAAMQHAKKEGGNFFQSFDARMDGNGLERLTLERHLRRAVARKEFMLQYQPQVDLRDGRILGAEALVRWRHPELGMIPPAKFIALAEETGLILDIGAWVLREACAQAAAWQASGHRGMQVAVNLSALQFRQPGLAEQVAAVLAETGLPAADLDLEITESTMVADPESAIATMQRLKAMGVKFSVDDFGTGYSSLAYLKRFPIDTLKIDRAFVRDCHEGGRDAALAETVINLARSLGLKVIAEGVETAEQHAFLRERGCDIAQGYLFSPPVGEPQFASLLAMGGRLDVPLQEAA
ncbi:MAG: EAL domain-containing protein [Rhodocyclaceae bacterium]|nr:EAL domain-containing protein [Rhodocyclaceae bacterium]